MKRTKFSKKLRKLTVRSLAALISLTVILSMVTVLGLVSFAADEEQMILLSADTNSNDIIIPIPKSTLSKNEYYKLTFKAKVLKGTKPIVGFLNVKNTGTNASPKYAYQAKPENVNNASFDGTLDMTGSAPQLYTNYDASNKMFTAIIKVEELKYISYDAADPDHNDIAGLLTIGNTEYGEGGEKDSELEFVFARPKLEHMAKVDGVWTTETDNAIELPELKTSNIDISEAYAYYDCSDTAGISRKKIKAEEKETIGDKIKFIYAPKNKYSTLANDLTKITLIDYNDNLKTSAGHNFIYVPEKEPTTISTGKKAHYTCDCGECDGKFYESEIESSLVDESALIIPETTEKTIVFEKTNKVSNVAVPLELKKAVESLADPTVITGGNDNYEVYLKLKFKARMFSGTKPVIGVAGKSSEGVAITYKENANNDNDTSDPSWADLSCNYDPAALEYTAIIKANVKNDVTGKDLVITIGNAEHDGTDGYDTVDYDVSFEMTEPELYILDPTTKIEVDNTSNLLNIITDYNTQFDNSKVITSVQGLLSAKTYTRDGVNNAVIKRDPIENFFNPNHNFVEVPKEEPTAETDGRRAYYYCKDCTVVGCCFADKKYSDKGYTEVTNEELVIKKFQMITISPDNNTNVFVPLDLSDYVTDKHLGEGKTSGSFYVKLTFDAKMIEGEKPIVSRIRGSSDLDGDCSYSEKDYADNTNETPAPEGQEPVLYSKFDKYTGKYEAVLKLQVGVAWSTLSTGVHDAILIGHSEHNGPYYTSESDNSISFSFANPELYLMDIATGEVDSSTGNLLPSISEGHLNLNENYVHNANPCKASNNIMTAPKNKWSVDGDPNNVKVEDITPDYFKYVEFTYHPQVDPTPTTDGEKAHYTCDDPTKTAYYGKKYWDKGITEITDPDNDLKITYSKMITIEPGSRSNVFIPLDLTKYSAYKKYKDASGYSYVMLKFKARMLKGEKPVVSRIRGDRTQGEGSHAEPYYVDNFDDVYDGIIENENSNKAVAGPDLYCKFDEDTGMYTAIIRLGIGVSWSTLSNGVHDAILIGNAEHNGASYTSESDSNVSFSFTSPELYLVNATNKYVNKKTGKSKDALSPSDDPDDYIAPGGTDYSTGNLMPPICEENLNKSETEGQLKSYAYKKDPYTASDHILSAPKNMWSTDGDASYVEYSNIEDRYFDYRFVRIDALEPTMTSEGHKAYYECHCDDTLCKYLGKKFSDKGMHEVTDDDIKLGKIKMITVGAGSNDNVYIPINISGSLKDKYKDSSGYSYLMLTFKARMYEGVKPVVSRVRGDWSKKDSDGNPIEGSHVEKHYVDNDDNEYGGVEPKNEAGTVTGPDLYCKFDETTNTYTAVIRLGVGVSWSTLSSGIHDAILIGHSEHNGPSFTSETDQAVSFSFTKPELYFIDITGDISTEEKLFNAVDKSTGNLIMPVCDQTNNLSETYEYTTDPTISAKQLLKAPQDMWSIDGKNAGGGIYMEEIPNDKYFTHHFVYSAAIRPTSTSSGQKAYYTCVCDDPNCEYAGKKYSDKGITEITDVILGKSKMITIGAGTNDNVYIPLNLRSSLKNEYKDENGYSYLMLKFKARMYTGVKPIVSRVRGDLTKKDTEGNTLEGSHAEKNYVDNDDNEYGGVEPKNEAGTVKGPDLYCKYDEVENEYVAVIRLGVGLGWSTLSSGVHDAILIGHSEHNGPSFTSETDQTASFSFKEPELYFIDITGDISTEEKLLAAVDTSTGNLIAPICDETNNLSATYEYTTDPTTSAKHLLKAPQDKWSIDGKNAGGGIYMEEIPNDKYFTHHFVYTAATRPTSTSSGQKAYYTCVCDDPNCEYAGKKYSDKGITEITDVILGKSKMITIGAGTNDNVYIPLNLRNNLKDKYKDSSGYSYLMLKFKARMYTGVKPIVSRVRGDLTKKDTEGNTLEGSHAEKHYVDNDDNEYGGVESKNDAGTVTGPDLYCKYDETQNEYTAVIRLGVGFGWSTLSSGIHDAILIGHSEHNGPSFTSETDQTASFSFADPELYFIDITGDISTEEKLLAAVDTSTGNLIAPICDETNNLSQTYEYTTDPTTSARHLLKAPQDKWSIDGKNAGSSIVMNDIPDKFFTHYFAYKPEIRPTSTSSGQKAYYTCVCGAEDCPYKGKMYSDRGVTEITNINLGIAKMITVKSGSNDNVYIPLNLRGSLRDKYKDGSGYSYLMLKFKARMYTGDRPVVSRVRGDLTKKDKDGNTIEGSHAEKNYVDNNDDVYDGLESKNEAGTVKGPDLYCKYDEVTNEYVAVIRLGVGVGWATLANGVHDAILIGHSEHNGPSFTSETDQTASFSFADPELYFIDITGDISTEEKLLAAVDTSTGNLIAPICDETDNLGETYEYTTDPTISAKHLLKAPQDKWSIDGKNVGNGIYMESIPDDKYFTHHFAYIPEIRPTPTTGGQRAYYTCVCGAADCKYAGKKYADKGITELTDITLGKSKMILFGANSKISNVFVPLSLKSVVKDKHKDSGGYSYVKLKFKTRILGGSYPIVSRIRGSSDLGGDYSYSEPGYADNSDHTYDGIENKNDKGTVKGPDLYTEYNPDTMTFTAIIRVSASSAYTTLSNGVHDAILIGNAEHNGNSTSESDYANSFIFAEPELYLLNASTGEEDLAIGNLMPPICDENINTEKTYAHNKVENIKSGNYTYNPCTLENHILSAPKDRWSVDGDNSFISYYEIPNGYFESTGEKANKITISNGASGSIISTTAKLKAATDYKVDIDYNAKNGGKLVVNYMMLNGSNEYVDAYDLGVTFEKTIDSVEGKHYGAVFTMPSSGLLGTNGDNFKLIIGATGGEVEFTNVKVRPISISGVYGQNALLNGDFRRSYASSTKFDEMFPFWNIENAAEVSKITSEMGINSSDFADTTPVAIYVKNTTGIFTTDVSLKPNTEYVFKFGSKYESEETAEPYVALKTASGVITNIGKYSTNVDGLHNTVYKFKTPSDLLGGLNATVGVNIDSKNIIASFSGFELYELSELGAEKGENYISDPYLLSFGTASSIWKKSDSLNVTPKPISIYHFKILEPKVLVFSGRNGMDSPVGADGNVVYAGNAKGYIETLATVEKGKQYIFSLNYKFAGEGYDLGDAKKGPELLINTAGGYVALAADKTVSSDEYKETYIFTTPDQAAEAENNFRFRFNVPGAMTSGYLANVSLRQYNGTKAEGEELIENGNFSTGDISGWSRSSSSHFYQFKFAEIPENFFSKTNPNKPSMIIFREPTDYAQFMQHLMVKPSTNYEIEYEIKHSAQKYDDKPAHFSIYMNEYTKKDEAEVGEDGIKFVLKADGRNVDASSMAMPSVYNATQQDIEKYADTTRKTYHSTVDENYNQKYRQILRFTTSKNIRTTGDGNILIRLYMRSGTAGFFGQVKLYELDENGNRIGNNLILNGDFSLGFTAWDTTGEFTARTVEQPDGFFNNDYSDTPKTMVYSNGSASNQTYGNTFKLKKGATYYFSGYYVNMNSQGLTPEIKYLSITGEYKLLQVDLYYSADSYYFEIKFQLPDDALFIDGFAEVQVYITNNERGKGYFHSLRLTEGSSYKNMFDDVGFVGQNGNYILMDYDPNVFVFYYDDTKFNDGDWSGEAELTDSDAKGIVLDDDRNGVSGIKMVLDPGDKTSETDEDGNYSFKELKPGTYSLYLVSPKTGNKVFCLSFDVEESQSITLPLIIYSNEKIIEDDKDEYEYDDKDEVVEVIGEVESKSRSVIQCLLFDEEGNRLSDIPIFIDDNGYAITNKKGIATFDNLQNFGSKKIYIYLDNGEKYIFRKVDVVEGKGTRIKLMFVQESDNTLLYILIFGGAGLLLAAGAAVAVILLLKKKASVIIP